MSLDERLSNGLEGLDAIQGSPPDSLLDEVVGMGRRRRSTRRLVAGAAAIAAVAAAVAIVPRTLDALDSVGDTRPASSEELIRQIAGTYTVDVAPAPGTVQAFDMAGPWTIRLLPSGAMRVSPPAAFLSAWDPPTGQLFTITDSDFRTNALGDLCLGRNGTYGWSIEGNQLTFVPIADDCAPRRALLASPWTRGS